jgi:hypothetical protein
MKRLVYICDWLPPDFGAVGQYAVLFARDWAEEGWAVTLVGLTSGDSRREHVEINGHGSLEIVRVHRQTYNKQNFTARLLWTAGSNVKLLKAALPAMRQADAVLFTGSPPLMLHFIAPLNCFLRKQLIYRITDFHPECLIAERGRQGPWLGALLALTKLWRQRVDHFEVLGLDQARRLRDLGIGPGQIELKRDPTPVRFNPGTQPLALPEELRGGSGVILYSGNWGIAHDDSTFIEGYTEYVRQSERPLRFWLNATGAKADRVASALSAKGIAFFRSGLVPLTDVPSLLLAADVHLITLRDPFVGYVLPSKIHACIQSGMRIIFVGSKDSDVHLLAAQHRQGGGYYRIDNGDVQSLIKTLHEIERELSGRSDKDGHRSWLTNRVVEPAGLGWKPLAPFTGRRES